MKIFYNADDIHKKNVVYAILVNHIYTYIGKTEREAIKRLDEHINSFIKCTCNRNFRSIINNDCDIEFVVIKECMNNEQCLVWEKRYIDCYQPNLNIKIN